MPGKKKLTDLTGDGKVTRKDFLRGAGVPGFEKGGKVYRDPPMEPVTGEEETSAFMDEMLFEDRRLKDKESRSANSISDRDVARAKEILGNAKSAKSANSISDRDVARAKEILGYSKGGMVRGCKGVQVSGKGFKGTF